MPLTDESPMPFGKYEGIKMKDVPLAHKIWLYGQVKRYAPNKMTLWEKNFKEYFEKSKLIE